MMRNATDERGRLLCPVCDRLIPPDEAVVRPDLYIVHAACLSEAPPPPEPPPPRD
jgi:hypothetical protein